MGLKINKIRLGVLILTHLFAFVLLSLLLSQSVVAREELKYNGTVDSGGVIPITEKTLTLIVESGGGSIIVQNESNYISIALSRCGLFDYMKICFDAYNYDYQKSMPQASITLFFTPIEANITRIISEVSTGEETTIEAVMESSKTISDVYYIDEFPPEIRIISSDCDIMGNSIVYKGELNKKKVCTYRIMPLKEISIKQVATLTYFNGFKKTIVSDEKMIKTSVVLDSQVNYKEFSLGEESKVEIKFFNKGNYDVTINNLSILFPAGLRVKEYDHSLDISKVSDNQYSLKRVIEANQSKSYYFTVQGAKIGISDIIIDGNYSYNNRDYLYFSSEKVEVKKPEKWIKYNISFEPFESFESGRVLVYVSNPLNISFSSIKTNIESSLFYIPATTVDELKPFGLRKLVDYYFNVPEVNELKYYNVNITSTYLDEFGNVYDFSEKKDIIVNPGSPVIINHYFSEQKDNKVIVSVVLTNPNNYPIENVTIFDTSENLKVTGNTRIVGNLLSKGNLSAYTYLIEFPETSEDTFTITTTASYTKGGKNFNIKKVSMFNKNLETIDEPRIEINQEINQEASVGNILSLDLHIKNTGSKQADDVVISLVPSKDYYVNAKKYLITLAPGEERKITFEKAIIPITKGSFTIKGAVASYFFNNLTNVTSSSLAYSSKEGYFDMPYISIDLNLPEQVTAGETFKVNVTIANTGTKDTIVRIENITANLEANEKIDLTLDKIIQDEGENVMTILGVFDYLGEQYIATSKEAKTYSVARQKPQTEKTPEPIIENEKIEKKRDPLIIILIGIFAIIMLILLFGRKKKPEEKRFTFAGGER